MEWELYGLVDIRVENFPGWELSGVRFVLMEIVRDGSYPLENVRVGAMSSGVCLEKLFGGSC